MKKQKEPKQTPREQDIFKNIKYIGYCWSNLPVESYGMDEFLKFAQFQLCVKTHRLMKDPIWDTYTKEELLAEFYAHIFRENKEEREAFEASIGAKEDMYDWLDRMVEQSQEENRKILEGTEDSVEFTPETLGD